MAKTRAEHESDTAGGLPPAKTRDMPELPYSVILRQLFGRLAFWRGHAAPRGTELTAGQAAIQLMEKLPRRLAAARDRRLHGRWMGEVRAAAADMRKALEDAAARGRGAAAVFAPHPQAEGLNDGYAQRIADVDGILAESRLLLYICDAPAPLPCGDELWVRRCGEAFYLKYCPDNPAHLAALAPIVNMAAFAYVHSVLRVFPQLFGRLHIPCTLDLHGAVPEEALLNGDVAACFRLERNERYAVERFERFVFITEAQRRQLCAKYGRKALCGFVLPAYNPHTLPKGAPPESLGRGGGAPLAVYAGGAQRWQLAHRMLLAMRDNKACRYRIFTQDTDSYRAACEALDMRGAEISHKPTGELVEEYRQAHYGFVLREDITVNNVAGPTKLTEYCTYGVVPILLSPNIGDFTADGMVYVKLEDFAAGRLPREDERQAMARSNLDVARRMMERYARGRERLRELASQAVRPPAARDI